MFVFNRFRAGIVPFAQIEGIMQFMMQWKLHKKGCCTMTVKALLISAIDILEFLHRFHNSLFFFFSSLIIYRLRDTFIPIPMQAPHWLKIATFINHTNMFGRHKAARGREYFSKYYTKQYFIKDNEHHSMYFFLEINIHFFTNAVHTTALFMGTAWPMTGGWSHGHRSMTVRSRYNQQFEGENRPMIGRSPSGDRAASRRWPFGRHNRDFPTVALGSPCGDRQAAARRLNDEWIVGTSADHPANF